MNIHRLERLLSIGLLVFAIGFNLWLYRLEPTATTDPNDNTFQYALVDRTNQMWDFASSHCPKDVRFSFCVLSYLTDHWVPNWAEGYNLPYYYSHAPQITIVASHRLLSFLGARISLFSYYHWITYLLLSFFPLSLFLALLITGLSPITAGFGALIATQLSTDGLYGLDPSSFLWRGYGLTSQLYAMIFFPLAIAYIWKLFQTESWGTNHVSRGIKSIILDSKPLIPAVLFLAATTAGHLGIGIIAFLSAGIFAISEPLFLLIRSNEVTNIRNLREILSTIKTNITKLVLLFGGVILLLGYWIFPILINGNYHNTSVWDPIWKFNSYGFREVLKNFFNGDLFDFGRFPTLTILVFIGLYASFLRPAAESIKGIVLSSKVTKQNNNTPALIPNTYPFIPFGMLLLFWLLMYFGTTTWGSILYLIPGMSDFHLSRFIVGVHMAGLFLIPIGASYIIHVLWRGGTKFLQLASRAQHQMIGNDHNVRAAEQENFRYAVSQIILCVIVVSFITPQTIRYASYNDTLIKRANANYAAVSSDSKLLITTLLRYEASSPGRVFAGRGGSWGKNFRVAETPYYMQLSTFGIPTVLWLPETWSPNSDTEQYFRENVEADYALYNVRYVVTPADLPKDQIQPFWTPLTASKTWVLYSVGNLSHEGDLGYVTTGIRPAIVSSSKLDFTNVIRLWIQSDYPKQGLYPELTFDKTYPKSFGLPNFRMIDETLYKVPDGSIHGLFAENPNYLGNLSDLGNIKIVSQKDESDMVFRATVTVRKPCSECLVILKQSFHPEWRATVDGKPATTFAVFPFYIAVKLDSPGTHEVVFSYQPSSFKILFLIISLIALIPLISPIVLRFHNRFA